MAAAVRLNTVLICRLPRRDIVPQRARGRRSPSCLRSGDGRPPLVSHRRSFLLHHHQTAARPSVRPRQLANLTRFHSPFSSYPSFSRSHPFPFRAPDSAGLTPEEQIEPRRKVALKFEAHNRGNTGIVTAVSEIRSCSSICGNAFEIGTRGAADSQSQVSSRPRPSKIHEVKKGLACLACTEWDITRTRVWSGGLTPGNN